MITPLQILTKDNALNRFQELAGNNVRCCKHAGKLAAIYIKYILKLVTQKCWGNIARKDLMNCTTSTVNGEVSTGQLITPPAAEE
jgi:hypothetical protein